MPRLRSVRMVGRARELTALRESVQQARNGSTSTVLVLGEAGLGKSRLVAELTEELRGQDALVLVSHGVDLAGGELPYGLVSEMFRDLARQIGVDALRDALGSALTTAASLLPGLLADEVQQRPVDRPAVVGAVLSVLERLGQDRLVCWLVEDLQWADEPSGDVVRYASRVLRGSSVLLVATVRTSRDDDELPHDLEDLVRSPDADVVRLSRLGEAEVRELLDQLVGDVPHPAGSDGTDRIALLSDGVPFFVEELAASGVGSRGIPTSVRRLMLNRVKDLSPSARAVLEACSVSQGNLAHPQLAAVVELPPAELAAALESCIEDGLLVVDGTRSGYRFRHALLREAVDDALLPHRRTHWHRRWGEALADADPDTDPQPVIARAHHCFAAADPAPAFDAALVAARVAKALGAADEESLVWSRLLELWPAVEDPQGRARMGREEVVCRLLRAWDSAGEWQVSLTLVEDEIAASAASGDWLYQRFLGTCRYLLNYMMLQPAEHSLPTEQLDDALRRMDELPPSLLLADTVHNLLHEFEKSRPDIQVPIFETLERLGEALGDILTIFESLRHRGWYAFKNGDAQSALDYHRRSLEVAPLGSPADAALAASDVFFALTVMGRHREALELGRSTLARMPHPHASIGIWAPLAGSLAWVLSEAGHWDEAVGLAQQVEERATEPLQQGPSTAAAVRVAVRRGDLDEARRRARTDEPVVIPEKGAEAWIESNWLVRHPRAECAAADGDLDALRRELAPFWAAPDLPAISELICHTMLLAARTEVGRLVRQPGDDEARRQLGTVLAQRDRVHGYGELGTAWRTELAALEARAAGQDTAADWRAAVEAWERISQPYDAALCRVRLAECLVRADDRPAARTELMSALATGERLDAGPLTDEVRRLAVAARVAVEPAPPRKAPPTTRALTTRETEVLTLLSRGRTNEQIASELFMSPKTASVHVSRIIAKLGVNNRTEAAALAVRLSLVEL